MHKYAELVRVYTILFAARKLIQDIIVSDGTK